MHAPLVDFYVPPQKFIMHARVKDNNEWEDNTKGKNKKVRKLQSGYTKDWF